MVVQFIWSASTLRRVPYRTQGLQTSVCNSHPSGYILFVVVERAERWGKKRRKKTKPEQATLLQQIWGIGIIYFILNCGDINKYSSGYDEETNQGTVYQIYV